MTFVFFVSLWEIIIVRGNMADKHINLLAPHFLYLQSTKGGSELGGAVIKYFRTV